MCACWIQDVSSFVQLIDTVFGPFPFSRCDLTIKVDATHHTISETNVTLSFTTIFKVLHFTTKNPLPAELDERYLVLLLDTFDAEGHEYLAWCYTITIDFDVLRSVGNTGAIPPPSVDGKVSVAPWTQLVHDIQIPHSENSNQASPPSPSGATCVGAAVGAPMPNLPCGSVSALPTPKNQNVDISRETEHRTADVVGASNLRFESTQGLRYTVAIDGKIVSSAIFPRCSVFIHAHRV